MSVHARQFNAAADSGASAGRLLVIARYALGRMFDSRLFVAFFLACYIPSLTLLGIIYAYHNADFIAYFATLPKDLFTAVDAWLLAATLSPSTWVSFLVVLVAGPALIAPDLANNAMPLYLSRGLRKRAYVLGKLLALLATAGAVTWVPGVLILLLYGQYVPERSFFTDIRLALALTATSLVWTGCLAMIAFAISAWVKTRPAATLGFLGLFVVAAICSDIVGGIFGGWWGSAVDLADAIEVVGRTLYGLSTDEIEPGELAMPAWAAWAMLLLTTTAAAAALFRRIRAGEVAA